MDDSDQSSSAGHSRLGPFGYSIQPDGDGVEQAASLLQREPIFVDKWGYTNTMIAAAIHTPTNRVAYVESRAKKSWWSSLIDVSIKIHLRDSSGKDVSGDIKSYNPFFGCVVGFFEWIQDTAVLIYEEKHDNYVCQFGPTWPPQFVEIEDQWIIKNGMLAYCGNEQETVQVLSIPSLSRQTTISVAEAERLGMVPVDPYSK